MLPLALAEVAPCMHFLPWCGAKPRKKTNKKRGKERTLHKKKTISTASKAITVNISRFVTVSFVFDTAAQHTTQHSKARQCNTARQCSVLLPSNSMRQTSSHHHQPCSAQPSLLLPPSAHTAGTGHIKRNNSID